MFEDDELKQVREGDKNLQPEDSSGVDKKLFVISLSFSAAFLMVLLVIISAGLVSAVTVGQVGGFVVEFGEIDGEQVNIYAATSESAACQNTSVDSTPSSTAEALPVLKADVGSANVSSISLTKDVKTPEIVGIPGFRINLNQTGSRSTRPDISASDLSFKFTNLQASRIELDTDVIIDEDYSQPNDFFDPIFSSEGEFTFKGQTANIQDGRAVTTLLVLGKATIPQSRLEIQFPPFVDATGYPEAAADGSQKEDEWIQRVQFAGIDNPSRGDFVDGYEDYTELSTDILNTGQAESISITSSISQFTKDGSGDIYPTVWIDWDQNNALDPGERYDIPSCSGDGCTATDTINVPTDAESGITLMRITIDDNQHSSNEPDDASAFDGEYEDYAVKVSPASPLPPINAKRTSSCPPIPEVG